MFKKILSVLFLLNGAFYISAQSYTFQHETLPCLNKKFTIVAHIFKDSLGGFGVTEQEIKDAVDGMNVFFAPIMASFEVCEFRYYENHSHDIADFANELQEIHTKYHADYRINMYFVNVPVLNQPVCGICAGSVSQPFSGGIFIKKGGCTSPGVLAHEMGHFFSLAHTFEGGGDELVNGDNCETAGDQICDTPADPYVPFEPMEDYLSPDCIFINNKTDANGEYYTPDVGNIMSYYSCGPCGFTWGQLKRMADTYLNSAIKLW